MYKEIGNNAHAHIHNLVYHILVNKQGAEVEPKMNNVMFTYYGSRELWSDVIYVGGNFVVFIKYEISDNANFYLLKCIVSKPFSPQNIVDCIGKCYINWVDVFKSL